MKRGERGVIDVGQALALLMVVVAIAAASIAAVGRVGATLILQQRVRAAADAAALAAVNGGRSAAEATCRANGCRVVRLVATSTGVLVTVEVEGLRARATATD